MAHSECAKAPLFNTWYIVRIEYSSRTLRGNKTRYSHEDTRMAITRIAIVHNREVLYIVHDVNVAPNEYISLDVVKERSLVMDNIGLLHVRNDQTKVLFKTDEYIILNDQQRYHSAHTGIPSWSLHKRTRSSFNTNDLFPLTHLLFFIYIWFKKKLVAICLDALASGAFKHTRCCKFEQKLVPSFSRGLPKFSPFVMHKGNKRWTENFLY